MAIERDAGPQSHASPKGTHQSAKALMLDFSSVKWIGNVIVFKCHLCICMSSDFLPLVPPLDQFFGVIAMLPKKDTPDS